MAVGHRTRATRLSVRVARSVDANACAGVGVDADVDGDASPGAGTEHLEPSQRHPNGPETDCPTLVAADPLGL